MNVQNVVECLNVMMMNSSKKKIGENVFRKWNIDKMFSSSEVAFLSNVIAQFQGITGKLVNYPCFLHNFLKWYLLNAGPTKKKLWNLFLITFLKPLQAGCAQNRSLKSGDQTIKVLHTHFHICQFLDFSPNA